MKKILSLFLFVAISNIAYCQNSHSIKFIYEGDETKPIVPLIISTEKLINSGTDKDYSYCFKTDVNTFNCIRNYIRISKYTILYRQDSYTDRFKIFNANGRIYYVYGRDIGRFYKQLQSILIDRNLDKQIIRVLNIY